MLFTYKAKTKNEEIVEDILDSKNRFELARELRSRGMIPLSISVKKEDLFKNLSSSSFFSKVKNPELIIFTKNLSGMLSAGLSMFRALSVLEKQTDNTYLAKILESLGEEINSGGTFSSGLEKYPKVFSKLFVAMARAGEESGNLAGALSEVGLSLEKSNAITKKVKGAMIYPAVILSAMVIIGILMFAIVVPALSKTFKDLGEKLPLSTQIIVNLGSFFSDYLILSFVSIASIALGLVYLFKAKFMQKYIDLAVLKVPVLNTMTKEINTARTARTMSSLLLSGVSILRAIEITRDVVQNTYYKKVLTEALESVQKGTPFFEIFKANENLYPTMMSEMVQVGEETGKLSEMLLNVAIFYEEEIENKTKNMSTIIEPVLMVFIGAAVGFFAISMITPLYSVMNNIK